MTRVEWHPKRSAILFLLGGAQVMISLLASRRRIIWIREAQGWDDQDGSPAYWTSLNWDNHRMAIIGGDGSTTMGTGTVGTTMRTAAAATANTNNNTILSIMSSLLSPLAINKDNDGKNKEKYTNDRHPPRQRCAINFYGLPRAFKSLVLPSVVENVIKPNAAYRCDYFVHYHNLTYEKPGRSGNGGPIHLEDVFLLKDAVQKQAHDHYRQQQHARALAADATAANNSSTSHYALPPPPPPPSPVVQFCQHTDQDLQNERRPVMDQILSNNRSAYYPWKHKFSNETVANIIKMWHGQGMVWDLMHQHEQRVGANYDRVAMLRSDMVFLTPIDIYQRGKQRQQEQQRQQRKQQQRNRKRRRGRKNRRGQRQQMTRQKRRLTAAATTISTGNDDFLMMDRENKFVVVPGFAMNPANDRMIYGPRSAVQIWASERFQRLEDHVRYMQRHPEQLLKLGDGIHSERFVAFTIFPAIERLQGVVIEEHPGICFVRARADETIWIEDCEIARYGATTPPHKWQLWRTLDRRRAVAERLIGRTCRTNTTIPRKTTLECGSSSQ